MPSTVNVLERGLLVLEAVERAVHPMNIQELAAAVGLQRLAVFRALKTLEQRGYVGRNHEKRYFARRRRRPLLGYLGPFPENSFREDLSRSLQRAAVEANFDLMVLDNQPEDAEGLLRNAATLLEAKADIVLFFQPMERLGHLLADELARAQVRFVTIERTIQGGVYFGANNFQAGRLAGTALGKHARSKWRGEFGSVVLLEGSQSGTDVQARLAGVSIGLEDQVGVIDEARVIHLRGAGQRDVSEAGMRDLLRRMPDRERMLVFAFNDLSAVGAAEAVRAAGRLDRVVIVGQNASAEGRAEMRREDTPMVASIAYFPERYGEKILGICRSWLQGEAVGPVVYTEHLVVHRGNLEVLYGGR
jgi:ribose transport system substrate-binding protein